MMEDVFIVCCIIHNILLIVESDWETTIDVECVQDVDAGVIQGNDLFIDEAEDDIATTTQPLDSDYDNTVLITLENSNNALSVDDDTSPIDEDVIEWLDQRCWLNFDQKVSAMVNHFTHCYNYGELRWMKGLRMETKVLFRLEGERLSIMVQC